jgi:hypothetical protein
LSIANQEQEQILKTEIPITGRSCYIVLPYAMCISPGRIKMSQNTASLKCGTDAEVVQKSWLPFTPIDSLKSMQEKREKSMENSLAAIG